ncbi:hypothetical protein HJC23_011381 [Cyclotella cryptica]|uniref:Uncharacterized protein n=1 Tax=Cyclotella cryptica TaxID=29204 RepID=A0ABD3PPN8_9STRA|eukprot:CCRYP_012664-RA/>CCRYP_012664-RA protein AED:0.36 eAED:0.36 QI:0/-1/0/1/-1/1/1/0/578
METPFQLRKNRCGLPPLLAFPPDPTHNISDDQSDSDEQTCRGKKLWENQLKELELVNTANRRIRWLLSRLSVHIDTSESCESDVNDLFPYFHSGDVENYADPITIFELNRITKKLNNFSSKVDIVFGPSETSASTSEEIEDTTCCRYWRDIIPKRFSSNNISLRWSDLLALPLEDAASDILELFEVNSDNKGNVEGIQSYLHYQAAEALRNIEEVTLPSLKQRLKQNQNQHHKMQMIQKEFANRYNKIFEQLDDYCMNVLRVESDTLPLCPLKHEESLQDETLIDSYARDIGKCAFEPMRKEFYTLSDRFVKLLTGVTMESSGERRYYGQSISRGIIYFRRFIEFITSSQDISKQQQSFDRNNQVSLETLYQFTHVNVSNNNQHSATCLSQFMNSPAVRAKLVSDLQQLEAFLTCRNREITRTSSRGFGHTLEEAIDMEWTQFCIKRGANQTTAQGVSEGMEKVSSDDIILFQEATHNVLTQIAGDGAQAKRLRLLADAVGYPSSNEATSIESFSLHFDHLCQKAANISYQMTFFDEQSKRMTEAILQIETEMDLTQKEVRVTENRIECICNGLKVAL